MHRVYKMIRLVINPGVNDYREQITKIRPANHVAHFGGLLDSRLLHSWGGARPTQYHPHHGG